jgi:hypothetical protein
MGVLKNEANGLVHRVTPRNFLVFMWRTTVTYNNSKKQRLMDVTIHALLTAPTIAKAAAAAGVTEASIRTWLKEPDFRRKYRETRQNLFETAMGSVQARLSEGVSVMWQLVMDEATPATARVQAFRCLAEMAFRGQDLSELESRIEQLERGNANAA